MTNQRKRKRKYKLVFPWNSIAAKQRRAQRNSMPPQQKRVRKKLRKEVLYVLFGALGLWLMLILPVKITDSKLSKMGYKKPEITEIRKQKLTKELIKNNWFSPYLAASIKEKQVNPDYLEYYTIATSEKPLNNDSFLLISRLRDRGYEEDQVLNLYKNLKFYELTPLLIFDYQFDETGYIEDCKKHSDNTEDSFKLTKNYYTPYKNSVAVKDPTFVGKLVNKTFYLNKGFEPKNLTTLSTYYAANDRQLAEIAANGLKNWGNAGRDAGVYFFATSAYRPYESQEKVYNNYAAANGKEKADLVAARPGYSEHQTGLAVDIAASHEDDVNDFTLTNAYSWCSANCQNYGWILRYPKGKEIITQYEFEPWHYRYLGKDLAQAVVASKLTFDEYFCLYLKDFDHEEFKPSQAILDAVDYTKKTPEETPQQETPKQTTTPEAKPKETSKPVESSKPSKETSQPSTSKEETKTEEKKQ